MFAKKADGAENQRRRGRKEATQPAKGRKGRASARPKNRKEQEHRGRDQRKSHSQFAEVGALGWRKHRAVVWIRDGRGFRIHNAIPGFAFAIR